MPIVVEQKSSFKVMPEGLHEAVIAQVKDLGKQQTRFGEKHTVVARFVNKNGEEASRFYTPSLNEKATLAKDLIVLKGAIPAKFDIESLVGQQVQILVTAGTNQKGQATAKVEKLLKPKAGQAVPLPGQVKAAPTAADGSMITDEDLGF